MGTTSTLRNTHAGARQAFCAKTFKVPSRAATWLDVVGLVPMSDRRLARIEVSDLGHSDHYSSLLVKIVHTATGTIDAKTFRFVDYLDEREDDRDDLPNVQPHIWTQGGRFEWYIAVPTAAAVGRLMAAVLAYIKGVRGAVVSGPKIRGRMSLTHDHGTTHARVNVEYVGSYNDRDGFRPAYGTIAELEDSEVTIMKDTHAEWVRAKVTP